MNVKRLPGHLQSPPVQKFVRQSPFALDLYTWSFGVILAGTLGFLVTSHFPE